MKLLVLTTLLFTLALTAAGQKPAFGIIVDNTGSLRTQFQREIELAKEVVKQLPPDASISLLRFKSATATSTAIHAEMVCSLDRKTMVKTIDGLYTVPGQTTLIDSIWDAADILNAKSEKCGEYSERTLVLITDGEDRVSKATVKDLIASLKKTNIKVFGIGLIDELLNERGFVGESPREKARQFLKKLTKETGGRVVFPTKKQTAEEIVKELIAADIRPEK